MLVIELDDRERSAGRKRVDNRGGTLIGSDVALSDEPLMWLFGFQWGVTVVGRFQLGFPASRGVRVFGRS